LAEHFRPTRETEAVGQPFDALRATGRNDLGVARCPPERRSGDQRGARAGSGRLGGANATLPDKDANALGSFHVRELDVRTLGKRRVTLARLAEAPEAGIIGDRAE